MSTPLFLDPSAAYTLTPIIWIGICVLCWLNLSWGVALSGLIVPGFLVPLILVYPASGALVLVEAILTWGITRALCRMLPKLSLGSSFFGRDRFFALVLCSIFVRIFIEGGLLPWFPGLEIRATAFGLILVPLIANQLWKPGLTRGLIGLGAAVGLTFVFFSFIFVPLSGFSLANLAQQMDLTTQYLPDSPQSYIILLTTIFLASRLNLHFGWDFSGIMFPGLIALSLFDPARIVSTIFETMVLVILAKVLMLWPPIRARALTGAYSLAFFFTLSFIYKILLGSLIPQLMTSGRSEDFLGLGYIMSSLFAIKICRLKNQASNLASTLTQASILGLVVGLLCSTVLSGVGSLFLATPVQAVSMERQTYDSGDSRQALVVHSDKDLSSAMADAVEAGLFAEAYSEAYTPPGKTFLDELMHGLVKPLLQIANQKNILLSEQRPGLSSQLQSELRRLTATAHRLGFSLEIIPGDKVQKPKVLLKDRVAGRNLGLMIITIKPDQAVGLAVGDPFRDRNTFEFGLWSLEHQNLAFLLVPTVHPRTRFDGAAALTHTANRINFLTAVLSQLDEASFPGMRVVELTAASVDQKRQQLVMNPSALADDGMVLQKWVHDLEQYGMQTVNGSDVAPTLVFESTLSLLRKQLYTLEIPGWVQRRMVPLLTPAEWEARWPLMNRPLVQGEALPNSTVLPDSLSKEALQDIRSYLVDNNPFKLLNAEAQDPLLHFDLMKVERNYYLLVKRQQANHVVALTGFPFGTDHSSGLALSKRTSAL